MQKFLKIALTVAALAGAGALAKLIIRVKTS